MAGLAHFAIALKESAHPPVEALKRVFAAFTNLTESDAVRLAGGAPGFLMRHLRRDAAQALQRDLNAEGIATVLVNEEQIPSLPGGKALHRMDVSPQSLIAYDVLGRTRTAAWGDIRLVAAGTVRLSAATAPQQVVEILLADSTRYQIQAEGFPFKYLIDRPDLSTGQKFVWLVREICNRAPQAVLNEGARAYAEGREPACQYNHPQALADEITWLLWQAQNGPGHKP